MDRSSFGNHGDSSEATLFCVATLHRFGLPFDYVKLEPKTMPEIDVCLLQVSVVGPEDKRHQIGQNHFLSVSPRKMMREGGRRLQTHDVIKRALKDLVFSNPNPGGAAFPASSILTEPRIYVWINLARVTS